MIKLKMLSFYLLLVFIVAVSQLGVCCVVMDGCFHFFFIAGAHGTVQSWYYLSHYKDYLKSCSMKVDRN